MPRTSISPIEIAAIPEELRARRQWVCWKIEHRGGKPTKVPYNAATGEKAKSDDPTTWSDFETALEARLACDGIGFMFSADDPYVGIDLDGCRDPATGELSLWAERRADQLATYTEISPSGTGLHLIGRGIWRSEWHKKLLREVEGTGGKPAAIEVYDKVRYFAFTGQHLDHTSAKITDVQQVLIELGEEFAERKPEALPRPALPLEMDDAELLEVARTAINGDRFRALFDAGDTSGHGGDDSAADLALCNHLAFYCRRDLGRMDRIFRVSQLYREKWDERRGATTYGQMTMEKAAASCVEVYTPPHQGAVATVPRAPAITPSATVNGKHSPEGLPPSRRPEIICATDLMAKRFPKMRWAVPNMIGEGLTLLAGATKAGKSYMCLSLAVAVAAGGRAFGKIPVEQGQVLYMALEDSQRRLQERLDDILQGEKPPSGLELCTEWPMIGGGFEDQFNEWLDVHQDARLTVVDVFNRVRPAALKNASAYDDDARITGILQRLALPRRVALLVLHHTRKASAPDPYDLVSGTAGMTGAADGVMVLMRQRDQPDAQLHFIGRDIGAQAWSLRWDENLHTWALLGEAALHQLSQQRSDIIKLMRDMDEDLGPKDVAEMLQTSYPSVRQLMVKMQREGDLVRTTRGKYRIPRSFGPDRRMEG